MMIEIIHQCIRNIQQATEEYPVIKEILTQVYLPSVQDSVLQLRVKLLVLLDQDEVTRKELVTKKNKKRGYFGPVPLLKANAFYQALHGQLIPSWVSNEAVTLDDFIDKARMVYLIA